MLDLPKGVITEKRMGGPSVLSLLAKDLIISKVDSYIRTEFKSENSPTKIGYVVFRNGFPLMAMHASNEELHSVDALEKIDDDAADLDCLLTLHRNIDVDLLLQTFPNSLLNLDLNLETDNNSDWWKNKEINSKTWTSSKILPEQSYDTTNSPEFERALETKLKRMRGNESPELLPGHAYLVRDSNPSNSIRLASKLREIDHQLMIISRIPGTRISQEYNIPREMCFWLTEKNIDEENIIGPQLELLYSKIKVFYEMYNRSVVVIDGFEFLYAIHGKDRALDFLRRLVDISTTSDDIALIPTNLDAFDSRTKSLIIRELDDLDSRNIEDWIFAPEELEGHLFHLPDHQEILWDEELNSINLGKIKTVEPKPNIIENEFSANKKKVIVNNEGSRLDLSGIIQEWDKQDAKNQNQFTVEKVEDFIKNDEIKLEHKNQKYGPKKATKVKRLGTQNIKYKTKSKNMYSNLKDATIASKNEKYLKKSGETKTKDRNKTYRQYYDASKHKSNSGGEH